MQAGAAWYGLSVDQVLQIVDEVDVLRAPGSHRSVVGVTPMGGRLVPLVRLVSLITDKEPAEKRGDTVILAKCLGSLLAFEVDDVEGLVSETPRPVPESWRLPWATGVIQHGGRLTPVVDLDVLAERLVSDGSEMRDEYS